MSQFDTVNLMKAFAEAGSAMEELPKTKADLEAAQALLDETNQRLNAEQNRTALLQATIEALHTELASKEAALADATKSSEQREALLDGLRALLGSSVSNHRPVPSALEAPAQAPQEPLTEEIPLGKSDTHTNIAEEPSASTEQHGGAALTATVALSEAVANTAATETESPEALPLGFTQPSVPVPPTPTENSTAPTEPEATASIPQAGEPDAKPYLDWGYWHKPDHMTWERWVELGGNAPSWLADLSQAF